MVNPEIDGPEFARLNAMRESVVTQSISRQLQLSTRLKSLREDWARNGPHKILATRVVSRQDTLINRLQDKLTEMMKSDGEAFDALAAEIRRAKETSPDALNVVLQKGRDLNLWILTERSPLREEVLDVYEREIDNLEMLMNRYWQG